MISGGAGGWPQERDLIQAVDELGFDSIWEGDHPAWGVDCWTKLAAIATVTRRVRLVSISCVYYRSPQMLARQAADVDRLSNGRLVLGLGAGWAEHEFGFLGIPYPPISERLRFLKETVDTVRRLWASPPIVEMELAGITLPMPFAVGTVQQPYVPLLIAGAGEQVILRQVAEYADMCDIEVVKALTPDDVHRKYETLRCYCAARGRPYDSVLRSHHLNGVVLAKTQSALADKVNALPPVVQDYPAFRACTPPELVDLYLPIVDAGAQHLTFSPFFNDAATAQLFAEEVMPPLQDYYASHGD